MPEETEGYVTVDYESVSISRDSGIPLIREFQLSRCMRDICGAWSEGECDEPYTVVIEDFDIDKARNFLAGGEYE